MNKYTGIYFKEVAAIIGGFEYTKVLYFITQKSQFDGIDGKDLI